MDSCHDFDLRQFLAEYDMIDTGNSSRYDCSYHNIGFKAERRKSPDAELVSIHKYSLTWNILWILVASFIRTRVRANLVKRLL